jgi:methyl-accepting chemotaxis protein
MQTLDQNELNQAWDNVERNFAVIVFDKQGNITEANDAFLSTMGYSSNEIVGQHHRIFCDADYANSEAYTDFWKKLGNGESQSGTFKRLNKEGGGVFLSAEYAPIYDNEKNVIRVIKVAQNLTLYARKINEQLGINEKLITRLLTM